MLDLNPSPLRDKYEHCDFFVDETYKKDGDEIVICGNRGMKLSATEAMLGTVRYTYDPKEETLTRTYKAGECHQCLPRP